MKELLVSPALHDLVLDFITNTQEYWGSNERQLKKFLTRKERLKLAKGWSDSQLCLNILSISNNRIKNSARTIYLPSFGSSGSHLLQKVIELSIPSNPLGEVYIAPGVIDKVEKLPQEDKSVFIEAYNLLHTADVSQLNEFNSIINTAHSPVLSKFSLWTANYLSMLILRDPVSLVISRTFRKDEYRNYILGSKDDAEYLQENIDKTIRFYQSASNFNFDSQIRFEDIVSCNNNAVEAIQKLLKEYEIDDEIIIQSMEEAVNGDKHTNKYDGVKIAIPEDLKREAENQLKALKSNFYY